MKAFIRRAEKQEREPKLQEALAPLSSALLFSL
jgi:hypothetical protein